MIQLAIFLALAALAFSGWFAARARARLFARDKVSTWSRPEYHASHIALWIIIPALIAWFAWNAIAPGLVDAALTALPVAQQLPAAGMERATILAEARAIAANPDAGSFYPLARELAGPIAALKARYDLIGGLLVCIIAFAGGAYGFSRLRGDFPARTRVERGMMLLLLLASLVAILTTFGIVASLVYETGIFFSKVSPVDFLTGTHWSPGTAVGDDIGGNFGAIPLFWGTFFIGAVIAMIVAIPLGLMSAIFLTQYASAQARRWIKPMLEILAGVPTVVYGYFAALTVAPFIRDLAAALGRENPSTESALAAGLVMGVMIIPFVSSMADDSFAAVPKAMADGSLAMGATQSETIKRVLIPAALPGIVAGVMLAVSRAIGETMIVVMAAGAAANLSLDPLDTMTTVTYQIVQLLTGDQEFDSPKTLSAFALGLVLFLVTLVLNIVALRVVKRFREAYD
jgi:phosphate transport system permease protein